MKSQMNTKYGGILIDTDVIAKYAGSVVVECFGIVGMAYVNMTEGIVRLLRKDRLTNGIHVELTQDGVILDFHVIVAYGVSISTVADNLIENVRYKVEKFTGMRVSKVDVLVEGVRVID